MTTNEDVLLKEVDDELTQDRQLALFKRYAPYAGAAFLAFLAAVAALEIRSNRADAARADAAEAYEAAINADAGPAALFDFAGSVPVDGYQTVALMRGAGQTARGGDHRGAIDAYRRVFTDESVPGPMRDLARVRAGQLALADGGSAADDIVAGVTTAAFAPFAAEITGLSAMARGDHAAAVAAFTAITNADDAPAGLAGRASTYLALARTAQAGVPLEATEDPDDFLGQFGRALSEGRLDAVAGADDGQASADGAAQEPATAE